MEINRMEITLNALKKGVEAANLTIAEKNALNNLLDKLIIYYIDRYNEIEKCTDSQAYIDRNSRLISEMTDYIVSINDTINKKNDAFCIVNMIYKEINYDEAKGRFKRKRLI